MSIGKAQVAALIIELKSCLKGSLKVVKNIAPRTFLFEIAQKKVLICLQEPFLRFHYVYSSYKTVNTPFSLALQEHLKGLKLNSILQLNDDRILELSFAPFRLIAEFFPKKPNLYLVDSEGKIILSLNPGSEASYNLPEKPLKSTPTRASLSSRELEEFYRVKEFQHEKGIQKARFIQRLKRLKKSEIVCEQALQMGLHWSEKQHEAELLQSNFFRLKRGLAEIEILDWENDKTVILTLDSLKEPKEEVAHHFKKAKKLRLSIEPLQRQLQSLRNEIKQLEKNQEHLEQAETTQELEQFKLEAPLEKAEKELLRSLPYREFFTKSGLKIWVGKDAKSNEKLTFSYARGSDWWLHVHNFPGAHVVLRLDKQTIEPDPESLQDAIQVALAYSSAKSKGVAEVCVTQVKYLSKVKRGKTGQVQVSKHRLLEARYDPELFRKLKERAS